MLRFANALVQGRRADAVRDAKTSVFIIGLGLVGGSLGLALRVRASERYTVAGFDADRASLEKAVAAGAIERAQRTRRTAGREAARADIVVVATPLLAMPDVFAELARNLRSPGAHQIRASSGAGRPRAPIVTDVGGAKCFVMEHALEHFAPDIPFVGGHPMAGSEQRGIECASADLFVGCRYALTPAPWADRAALERIEELCRAIGAVPHVMNARDHDSAVAVTSHLPLVVAACLATVAGKRSARHPSTWDMAASGFRDTTRLASGDPEMGLGMLVANAERVLDALAGFREEIDGIRALLEASISSRSEARAAGRAAIRAFLSQAQAYRRTWLECAARRPDPTPQPAADNGGVAPCQDLAR